MRSTVPETDVSRTGIEGTLESQSAPRHVLRGIQNAGAAGSPRARRHGTVLVAESTPIFRSAARSLIEERLGAAVAEAGTLDAVIAAAEGALPRLALVDYDLPPQGGMAAIAFLERNSPATRTVAWFAAPTASAVFDAVEAGAVGCLEKALDADALSSALAEADGGGIALSRRCAALLVAGVQAATERRRLDERMARLTRREREVLALVAEGQRNREIGAVLCITEATVKHHVSSILDKLDARTRREAARAHRAFEAPDGPEGGVPAPPRRRGAR